MIKKPTVIEIEGEMGCGYPCVYEYYAKNESDKIFDALEAKLSEKDSEIGALKRSLEASNIGLQEAEAEIERLKTEVIKSSRIFSIKSRLFITVRNGLIEFHIGTNENNNMKFKFKHTDINEMTNFINEYIKLNNGKIFAQCSSSVDFPEDGDLEGVEVDKILDEVFDKAEKIRCGSES